jgi:3-oxoacyl-[acyl-carrier protein] reductase
MRLLEGRVALVTGAGRGLGQSVARAYAQHGAQVIATSRTQSELDQTAAMVKAEGGQIETYAVDLVRDEQVRAMADRILADYGRLDVLVNNAGRLFYRSFAEVDMEDWFKTLTVNLRAPALLSMLFLKTMLDQGHGSIINVSSRAGIHAAPRMTDYNTAKFGLEGFTKALALELKPRNIAVNTITPGGLIANVRIKPTSVTQADFEAMSPEEQAQWSDSMLLTEAFVFLALQGGDGVTGERVYAWGLSEKIRQEGWEITYDSSIGREESVSPS